MMMKGSCIVLHSCRLYIIAEEHIEYEQIMTSSFEEN